MARLVNRAGNERAISARQRISLFRILSRDSSSARRGIERDGPVVIGPGPRQIAPFAPDEGAIEVTDRRRWIQFEGASVICQRAFEVPFGQSRRAASPPAATKSGRSLMACVRSAMVSSKSLHAITRSTAIVIGFRTLGIELDGAVEIAYRSCQIIFAHSRQSAIVPGKGQPRLSSMAREPSLIAPVRSPVT